MPSTSERTFIAIKPDGVQRNLVGKIIQRFEERGYKLVGMKLVHASKQHLEVHYQDLKVKFGYKCAKKVLPRPMTTLFSPRSLIAMIRLMHYHLRTEKICIKSFENLKIDYIS